MVKFISLLGFLSIENNQLLSAMNEAKAAFTCHTWADRPGRGIQSGCKNES